MPVCLTSDNDVQNYIFPNVSFLLFFFAKGRDVMKVEREGRLKGD